MNSYKIETEAKFIIPNASVFAALQQITHLGNFELKPIGTHIIVDRYLDTAEKQMLQVGYACRIRESHHKQFLTLKSLTPAEDELHRRQEIELEIETDQPRTWAESEAKRFVLDTVGPSSLQTLFTIYQTRHQYHALLQDQPVIEFSLDAVSLTDANIIDYFELEVELIEMGTEADLASFIEVLQTNWSLPVQNQSKFECALAANTNQTEGGEAMIERLSDVEKSALIHIEGNFNKNLARRASIILMSEAGISPENIAQKLELTVRTVRHWQREFQQKRLKVFPEEIIDQAFLEKATVSPNGQEAAEKPRPKKVKRKKSAVIEYPTRKTVGLEPTDTMAEAGRKVISFHFARMLEHEPGTRMGEDIEELHDMRVATRRMRAAFNVFGQSYSKKKVKTLQQGLKATAQALGRVRDLDVFIQKMEKHQQSLPEDERPGLAPLLETWRVQRGPARRKMLAYLDSKQYPRFKQNMLKFVKTEGLGAKPIPTGQPVPYQLRHIVPRLIYTRYEAVFAFDTVLENASLETLHSLRLTFKAFRYTLEYFSELLGEETKMVISQVKRMQDYLGDLNDADVASGILRDYLADWEQHQLHLPLTERQSPAQMVGYLTAKLDERHQLVVNFPETWAKFNNSEFRRNLALAVAAIA